jgi:hypothetical protein
VDKALRSGPTRILLAAALVGALILGVGFIVVHRMYDLRGLPTISPQTDEQSRQQVLGPARQIIAAGSLRHSDATYLLASCTTEDKPPYQGTVYVGFAVPDVVGTRKLFRQIAQTMRGQGWRVGLPPGRHPGGWTLAKDGVTAIYYRDPDQDGRGVLRVYGECRVVVDHQRDGTGFMDVTRELSG